MSNGRNKELIKWLSNIGSLDLHLVGGKALHLGEMMGIGVPVPEGFCITTGAFERITKHLEIEDRIAGLGQIPMETEDELASYLSAIRSAISSCPMPKEMALSILGAYHQLKSMEVQGVAVRSSATAEDLPETSLAGQFVTRLNIQGDECLLYAVRECWASLFSEGVLAYADAFGIDPGGIGMAVIVQSLVVADKSGVMFTAHPVTRERDKLLIEAAYGLGLSTVGGMGNPDRYVVNKRTLGIVETQISHKGRMVVPLSMKSGVEEIGVSSHAQSKQCLSKMEIGELTRLGLRIEEYFGSPQDIEWAVTKGVTYILQARDITSL